MPNGKPGDHPVNDILVHGEAVFSPDIDEMIRELHRLSPATLKSMENEIFGWSGEMFGWRHRLFNVLEGLREGKG